MTAQNDDKKLGYRRETARQDVHDFLGSIGSGVAWVMGARGGLQFYRPQKSWGLSVTVITHIFVVITPFSIPLLIDARGGPPFYLPLSTYVTECC